MRHDYGPTSSSSFGLPIDRELRHSEENTNTAPAAASGYSSEDSMYGPYRSASVSSSMMDSNNRPRSHSVPSSPLNFPAIHEQEPDWQRRDLHHSMPNIHFSFSSREQSIDEMEEMHHSLPNMHFESELDFEPETEYGAISNIMPTGVDPIPLNIAFTGARAEPVPSAAQAHAAHHAGYQEHPMERLTSSRAAGVPSHHHHHHDPSDSISRDLILCLEKLTESTIADPDDPYAPIPLSPQGPKRRPSLAVDRNDFPRIDDPAPSSTFDEHEE
jgi:hypothetical protein